MDWKSAIVRARRGFRDDRRLYLVAISSLTVAFLCLGGALVGVANLGALAERWGQNGRLTIYLEDEAREQDVAQLRMVLESLDEIRHLEAVTPAQAQAELLAEFEDSSALRDLPANLLPASLEITLAPNVGERRTAAIAARISQFRAVESVDTYRNFFDRLKGLLVTGRGIALALAILVSLCVLAVVNNTIRLSIARRQREIEVLKLCGATDGFVRRPFIVEGVMQAFVSAFAAVTVLAAAFVVVRSQVDSTLAGLLGTHVVFLSPAVLVGMLAFGALIGAAGSVLSLRRYLAV